MSKIGIEQMRKQVLLVLLAALVVGACAVPTSAAPTGSLTSAPPTSALQQLRITNSGQEDIAGLVVLLPGGTGAPLARIEYGNVAAGETTGYRDVPHAVYRYAAYEFMLDGQVITEPAVDWIGESPLAGRRFTYQLALDSQKEPMMRMQLLEALVDEP